MGKKRTSRRPRGSVESDVSRTELTVLEVLWERGPSTVRDVDTVLREQGTERAYTTVLTLLQRLQAKGWVTVDGTATPHVFAAAVSRDGLLQHRLEKVAEELTDGAASPLVQCLVENHRFTSEEIDHFRALLDDMEGHDTGPKRQRRRRS